MLSSVRAARLCPNCCYELLAIFERGFRGPPRSRPLHLKDWLNRSRSYPTRRFISSSSPLLQEQHPRNSQQNSNHNENNLVGSHNVSDGPGSAIQELQEALGKSLEEAIEEDQIAAKDETNAFQDDQASARETINVKVAEDSVAAVRESGADVAEIVREARQIFGDSLPDGVLQVEETEVYNRLYGEPEPSVDEEYEEVEDGADYVEDELFDHEGHLVRHDDIEAASSRDQRSFRRLVESGQGDEDLNTPQDLQFELSDTSRRRVESIAESVSGELLKDSSQPLGLDENETSEERSHPLTRLGQFGTSPSTVNLPRDEFIRPLENLMSGYSNKHLKEVCERAFGGGGLPDSPLTPRSGKLRPQVAVSLEASQFAMSEMEANAFLTAVMPPAYAAITSVLVETRKRLGPTWLNELLAKEGGPRILDAGAGGAGILAWNEVVKAHWKALHTSDRSTTSPPACKTVVLTGSDPLRHRSAALLDNTTFIPRLPDYTRTRDLPTLEDSRPAQQRKQFDVVIAPYSLLPFKEEWERKLYVQNLWSHVNPSGGVLLLIEKGIPRGFEAIASARELLLERHIASPPSHPTHYNSRSDADSDSPYQKSTGMIIAPCTNHTKCPLYKVPGTSQGRKDICSFQQRYIRPPHLQRVLGAKDRNHDDVDFSYISVMKGRDLRQHQLKTFSHLGDPLSAPLSSSPATSTPTPSQSWLDECQEGFLSATPSEDPTTYPPPHLLPRLLYPPLKRRGHIILDVCTPLGSLERWTVPRSFGRLPFRDARKSQHGDLWALGAKTRIPRSLKVGVGSREVREMMKKMPGGGGGRGIGTGTGSAYLGKPRSRDERLKNQAVKVLQKMEEEREIERQDRRELEEDLAVEFDLPVREVREVMRENVTPRGRSKRAKRRDEEEEEKEEDYEDPAIATALSDWEAEYAADTNPQRKRGGAFRDQGVGKSSKAAKRMQLEQWRRDRAEEKQEQP